MKKSERREALAPVQDLIARRAGTPVGNEGDRKREAALRAAIGHFARSTAGENFQSLEVTVLLADLRGFTAISAAHPVGTVLEMLNRYLVRMSEVIARNQGTIDKFMGDSIMVLFGAHPDDVRHALACAVEMQAAMVSLNEYQRQLGLPELYMGIGINTGTVMAGLLGSDLYSAYTVIGDEVNLASRIESFSLRGQVLISQGTFERSGGFVVAGEPMDVLVKGKPTPVAMREVMAIPSLNIEVPRQEIRRSPRVEVKMPSTYQLIENKIIMPEARQGTIFDISYQGILAELDEKLAPYSDIKLNLELSLIGRKATDVYAKVMHNFDRDGRSLSGIEFTSVSVQSETDIRQFVQLLLQGSEVR